MNGRQVELCFSTGSSSVAPGDVKIIRKGKKMNILEP